MDNPLTQIAISLLVQVQMSGLVFGLYRQRNIRVLRNALLFLLVAETYIMNSYYIQHEIFTLLPKSMSLYIAYLIPGTLVFLCTFAGAWLDQHPSRIRWWDASK